MKCMIIRIMMLRIYGPACTRRFRAFRYLPMTTHKLFSLNIPGSSLGWQTIATVRWPGEPTS